MKKMFCIWLSALYILLAGCSSLKKNICVKKYMSNHKFMYIVDGVITNKYFILKDSIQLEFSGNDLYSESAIIWNTCYDYSLIVKRIYYKEKGLQPGDTLSVKIQSSKKDTLECIGSAYNHSFLIKFLKVNKTK
jgi:hypothetical protein